MIKIIYRTVIVNVLINLLFQTGLFAQPLPYSNEGRTYAIKSLKGTVAFYAGSRYAYVDGYKVRLDNEDIVGTPY